MGGASYHIENGLYGFKGDLRDGFRNNEVPRWLSAFNPTAENIEASDRNGEFLRKWRLAAQKRKGAIYVSFAVKGEPNTKLRGEGMNIVGRSNGRDKPHAPEKILERCKEYVDSGQHRENMAGLHDHTGRFDGFQVSVYLGKQGGINEISLTANYRD